MKGMFTRRGSTQSLDAQPSQARRTSQASQLPDEPERPLAPGEVPVSVVVRCRPLLKTGKDSPRVKISSEKKTSSRYALHLNPGDLSAEDKSKCGMPKGRDSEPRSFRCNGFCSEDSTQEEVFSHAASVVDKVMDGYNGTIFCYGITGSGKSYTMSGRTLGKDEKNLPPDVQAETEGIVQRASKRIFEFIRDRGKQGDVFSVETSFLEIYSGDGITETLIDLLADLKKGEAKLEMRMDPLNKQAFVCDGLRSVQISGPEELCNALESGRRRCVTMETTRNCQSSRSHCIFQITVECLSDKSNDTSVRRGKLMLVDLAGSESLKRVTAATDGDEALRRKQAIGINRVLSHLGAVVNNLNSGNDNGTGFRNSALTMLLRDCLGGSARALLIANIGPEIEWCAETYMTLTFAQKMMQVRNTEKVTVVDQTHSTLLQLRSRHEECIKALQEGPPENGNDQPSAKQLQDFKKMQDEAKELGAKLLTKSSATEALDRWQEEHKKKMEAFREEIQQDLSKAFATVQEESHKEWEEIRQVIDTKARESDEIAERVRNERDEAELKKIQDELDACLEKTKTAVGDVAQLKQAFTLSDQRVHMLNDLQEDTLRERYAREEEKRNLQTQTIEQTNRLLALDGELQRYRAEASVITFQITELQRSRESEEAAVREERGRWQRQEAELKAQVQETREKATAERARVDQLVRSAELEHRQTAEDLRGTIVRLEAQDVFQRKQLEEANEMVDELEASVEDARNREVAMEHELEDERSLAQEDLHEANRKINELLEMLHEMQEHIIQSKKRGN